MVNFGCLSKQKYYYKTKIMEFLFNKKKTPEINLTYNLKELAIEYSKFYFRSTKKYTIIDNSSEIIQFLGKKNKIGGSSLIKKMNYQHQTYKNLNFIWLNHHKNFKITTHDFFFNLRLSNYAILLKNVRGGVRLYCSGFLGFITKQSLKNIITKTLIPCLLTTKKKFRFYFLKKRGGLFFFRLPIKLETLKIRNRKVNNQIPFSTVKIKHTSHYF